MFQFPLVPLASGPMAGRRRDLVVVVGLAWPFIRRLTVYHGGLGHPIGPDGLPLAA